MTLLETSLKAVLADFAVLQQEGQELAIASPHKEELELLVATTNATYAMLVQRDFLLLNASDVGTEHFSAVAALCANKVVAGHNFIPRVFEDDSKFK